MKLTSRMLRAAVVVGVATVAPLVAAIPAHAGLGIPQGPAAASVQSPPWEAATDVPPGPNAVGPEYATDLPPGPTVVGPEYVTDLPPGPGAGIIAI
jgi:hypothetical protein